MPTESQWTRFGTIAALHCTWRSPAVRKVLMSLSPELAAGRARLVRNFGPNWRRALAEEFLRFNIVRPLIAQLAQRPGQNLLGVLHGFHAHREYDAPPAHKVCLPGVNNGQSARLAAKVPGAVEADAAGEVLCVHGCTIPGRTAEAM